MEWVAIDVHIAGDAVTHRLAERFRLRVAEAAGLLTLAFAGMAQHAQDGALAEVTDSQIEAWAMWHGKRGAFAAFFREQLCDEDGVVRAWEKYNGRSIRRAEAAKERSREWREQRERERTERAPSANGTHTRTHTVRRTRQDQTRPNLTTKSGGADAPPREYPDWVPRVRADWQRLVGRITPAVLTRELSDAVAVHGIDGVLAAIERYADERVERGRPLKLEWFAAEVASWVKRAEEDDDEPVVDGWLSADGDRATSPNGVAR